MSEVERVRSTARSWTAKFGPRPTMGLYATGFLAVGFFLHAAISLQLGGLGGFLAQTILLIVAFGAFAWLAMRAGAFVDGLAEEKTIERANAKFEAEAREIAAAAVREAKP